MNLDAELVLNYWFATPSETAEYRQDRNRLWFGGGPAVDAEIRDRFEPWVEAAEAGRLDAWESTPRACLALLVLLDQFPLNIYRNQARAYELGDRALPIAQRALAAGFDRHLHLVERIFLYLPLEHAEDLQQQREAVRLFAKLKEEAESEFWRSWADDSLDFAKRHMVVVERFGRFPHRNEALKRQSTEAELEYLALGRWF